MAYPKIASFGEFIKEERERQGWTQTDLGAKIGINSGAVSKIEHGRKQLTAGKLLGLSQIFGVELTKIKELYFAEKIAKEVCKNDCPESVFEVAASMVKYLKGKNARQAKINFGAD
jgi:transcriptional regulator with XRE-family HTH domain